MPQFMRSCTILATALMGFAASAAPIAPITYDTPNGSGVASSGSFNYWDLNYTGIGSVSGAGPKTADAEFLSGGLGDLTDGITTSLNWLNVEVIAGTGPYVGWRHAVTATPTVLFRFGGPVVLDSITIHMDDSDGAGGVDPAAGIGISTDDLIYATTPVVDPPAGSEPFSFTIPLAGLVTDRLFVRFDYQNEWIFVDEVSFDGRQVTVPVPGSLALTGLGLLAFAAIRRKS